MTGNEWKPQKWWGRHSCLPVFAFCILLISGCQSPTPKLTWRELAPLPDPHGFAGAFAGTSANCLIVAGGANFPEKMPWEGGTKVFHDKIFLLDQPTGQWREVGRLPRPLAYGVSVSTSKGMVCIGGSDAKQCYADVFALNWNGKTIQVTEMPPLPIPLANACGVLIGQSIYIAGGEEKPGATVASMRAFKLDLMSLDIPQWTELPPLSGQSLACAGNLDGDFVIFGGVELTAGADGKPVRRYLRTAWRLTKNNWERLADLPHPLAAGPTPAAVASDGNILLLGGDDGSKVGFAPPEKHPGFSHDVLMYNPREDRWSIAGQMPSPRATLTTVRWRNMFVLPSGEVRPGVRSPKVWWMESQ